MLLHSPFHVVTSAVDGDVLAALAGATERFTLTRLQVLVPHRSRAGLRRALHRLVEQGIVNLRTAGTTHTYSLNREHLAAPAILELASLRHRLLERLRDTLSGWSPCPTFSALFGSAARGTMESSSDIDLFIVHPGDDTSGWDPGIDDLASSAQRWTGNAVNILVMTDEEIRGARDAEPVLSDIARDGLPVLGTMSSFTRHIGGSDDTVTTRGRHRQGRQMAQGAAVRRGRGTLSRERGKEPP